MDAADRDPLTSVASEECRTLLERAAAAESKQPSTAATRCRSWPGRDRPTGLDAAISAGAGGRYHAVVVDEGQDFARSWLESLYLMLTDPEHDVLYVFHDPGQALYRDDVVATLGLPEYPVEVNCRNTAPIHRFAARYAPGLAQASVLREDGREVEKIEAAPGRETLEALRRVLHRLVADEGMAPWQIAVLTGVSLAKSEVWRQRRFGNQVLWNGAYDDAGHSLGLPADQVPEQPTDTILCDSIRRFKGLEREVVVLVELDESDPQVEQLLYVGAPRARQHLIPTLPAAGCPRAKLARRGRPSDGRQGPHPTHAGWQ